MAMSDTLGDMITRIRNGQRARLEVVDAPLSNMKCNFLDVLQREGYIRGYTKNERNVRIELKYFEGRPAIEEIKRVSTPGQRIYSKINDLHKVRNGLGITVLSTPQGVLSDNEARAANVGGEVLCQVF